MIEIGTKVSVLRASRFHTPTTARALVGNTGVVKSYDASDNSYLVNMGCGQCEWFGPNEITPVEGSGKFWMILKDGTTYTKVRHNTYVSVSEEAERLAKEMPGSTFFILEAVGKTVGKVEVEVNSID